MADSIFAGIPQLIDAHLKQVRGIKELASPVKQVTSEGGAHHQFNINMPLNKLLVKALKKTGQLTGKQGYTLDYDNQVIPTEKYDTKKTYKKCNGYQPGWPVSVSTLFT